MQDERKLLKKRDTVIIVIIAAMAAAGLFLPELLTDKATAEAVITYEGRTLERVPLGKDGVYEFPEINGMKFTVENGEIYVSDSNCGDRTCMRTGKISRNGEAIVCVPNKAAIIIENSAADNNDLDVILR